MDNTAYLVVRTTKTIRNNFNNLCKSAGIKSTDAVRMLMNKVILSEKIPFNFENISINDSVVSEAISISFRVSFDTKKQFVEVCEKHNISSSTVIRAFMLSSIATRSLDLQ